MLAAQNKEIEQAASSMSQLLEERKVWEQMRRRQANIDAYNRKEKMLEELKQQVNEQKGQLKNQEDQLKTQKDQLKTQGMQLAEKDRLIEELRKKLEKVENKGL